MLHMIAPQTLFSTDPVLDPNLATTVLRGMFAARKSVFVDLLKWNVPVMDGRFEVDQFDDGHARYLVLCDEDQGHLASARLLPTTRPHILDTLYVQLCDGEVPRGPDIFEITRFCLDRTMRSPQRRAVRDTLVHGLVTHALGCGIRSYTAIAQGNWARQIMAFGWDCRPLGPPRVIDGSELWALHIEIDAATGTRLLTNGIGARRPDLARAA